MLYRCIVLSCNRSVPTSVDIRVGKPSGSVFLTNSGPLTPTPFDTSGPTVSFYVRDLVSVLIEYGIIPYICR